MYIVILIWNCSDQNSITKSRVANYVVLFSSFFKNYFMPPDKIIMDYDEL